MKLLENGLHFIVLLGIAAACSPPPSSNKGAPGAQKAPTPSQQRMEEVQGVINGGGGKGVRCTDAKGKTTLELLDLYEARTIYKLKVVSLGNSREKVLDWYVDRYLWENYGKILPGDKSKLRNMFNKALQELEDQIHFLKPNQRLKDTKDDFSPITESGCELVQIAAYYDESVLLIDPVLWEHLNWTHRFALLYHELAYRSAREKGATNSMTVRRAIAYRFSEKGLRSPRPDSETGSLHCMGSDNPNDPKKFINFTVRAKSRSEVHPALTKPTIIEEESDRCNDPNQGVEISFDPDFEKRPGQRLSGLFRISGFLPCVTLENFIDVSSLKDAYVYKSTDLAQDTYSQSENVLMSFEFRKHLPGDSITTYPTLSGPPLVLPIIKVSKHLFSPSEESAFQVTCNPEPAHYPNLDPNRAAVTAEFQPAEPSQPANQ